jgi:hypothetical protein
MARLRGGLSRRIRVGAVDIRHLERRPMGSTDSCARAAKHNDGARHRTLGAQRHTYNGTDRQHQQQIEDEGDAARVSGSVGLLRGWCLWIPNAVATGLGADPRQ